MAWVTALCFLGSQICLVLGQGFIPQVPREVPSRAGVINDSPTAGPWVIFELRLFFDVECQKESQLTPFFTEVYDTGTHRETELFTNGQYVFDGAEYTNWTADCRVSLGGCPARTVSVGADITGLAGYTAAVARKDALWNITGPLFDAITIKCFRIWQSSDPRHKCNDIGIVRGYPNGNDYLYDVVEVFHAVSGGDWAQRPALFDTLWRVQNLEVTYGQWSLSELHFFEDVLCTFPLLGQAFAIGSDNALVDGDVNAFDHNVTSVWTALCPDVPNSRAHEIWGDGFKFHGCEPEQAFIGQEYQVASTVRCLRFFQKTPRDISDREQRISWSAGIALQRWSGEDWFTTERFWDSAAAYDPVLAPTMVTPFVGGAPGTWEDLRPPSRSAWRLSNDVYTRGQWVVHELEFHTAAHCLGDKLKGEPLAMQGPQNLEIRYAFDGDTRQDVGWTSSCSSRTEGITCVPAEAWLGIYVRGQQPVVKCFRILQSKYLEEQSAFVSLGVYIDGNWQFDSFHREIGGGTWNRRPALPWTIWRLRNNEALEAQWRVAELKAYRDPLCLVEMTPGSPLASGYNSGDAPGRAMDGDASSLWTANCATACNETRKYWLGVELPNNAPEAEEEELMVRCFRIWQSERLEQQMISTQIQLWNGEIYILSPMTKTGSLHELGGGVWSRPAASFMTRWRLVPKAEENRHWRVLELEMYADSKCRNRLPVAGLEGGGETVLASSYFPLITGFRRAERGKMWSEAQQLSDLDTSTGILIRHEPNRSHPGFLGVDYLSGAVWVRCVKLMQGSMPMEYVPSVTLQLWDGAEWRSEDPELSSVEVNLNGLGGGGWQRRPAEPGTLWRLENAQLVPQGWAVYEVEFFEESNCNGKLRGDVVASGYAPPLSLNGPENAVDGNETTVWMSQCCPVEEGDRPRGFELLEAAVGCAPGDAWVGLDLGADNAVEKVGCVRLFQVGFEEMQTLSAVVAKWNGFQWSTEWRLDGLGGSAWNRRPAASNTMWRLLYKSRKAEPCPNQLSRIVQRPWGIADLKFFSDDDCQDEITGGNAMTSGGFDHFHPSAVDQDSYLTSRMVDDDPLSTWTANCRTGFYNTNTDLTNCSGSWVGMQFRDSEEVRCVSIVQSRWESARCCDAADELELQRWNGSSWIEASWFRRPPVPAVKTEFNFREPTHIGGTFANLGACPSRTSDKRMFEETIREQRSRRDSEKCIVQLTGAVTLLAEPYCIKHPRCVSVFGTMGTCCPIGDLVQSENRCCCGFLGSEPIFADEISLSSTRDKLSFEYSAIWVSNILPWIGLAVTVALYLTAVLMPAEMEMRCKLWIMEEMERTPGHRVRLLLKRLWVIGAWPWLSWRSFLATSKSQVSHMVRWFILPDGRLPKPLEMYRSLLFLIFGSILSGMAPWLLLGAICGEMMIWLALQLCQVIRYFKSPFDPLDLRDMQLRQNISRVMVKDDEGLGRAFDVAAGVATTIVYGLAFFGKFIFDLLIVRAQMLSVEAIENIEADKVVELFPGLLETLQEPAMLLYDVMYYTSQLISWTLGQLVGIPLCEGSCALAGSVALVMILYGASQWLNYDLFGLFVASRQVVKATRPECQRILAQSLILLCLGASFAAVQMTMVLFTRALAFANPFTSATWVCPYDDTLAIFVGRILLTGSSIIGVLFVFLCVNGHFVGQDYITERVAHFLGIDLAELDPDGTGEEGGMFRFDVFGAALPTLFGVWWDPWNIDAYLVRERAHVYSMELRDPQACKHCEKIHVQYELMMTATGRTVSAAVQIVPYGAVVAKACEYLNDPPLIYIGTKMSCMRVRKLELTHTKGTKNVLMWSLLFIASILAYSIEYAVPFLKRVTSVMMLVYLFMGTFTLTERNLVDQGTYVILAGFTLSFVKAALEKLVPALLSYGLSGVYFVISRAEGTLTHRNDIARTLTGQALSGATCATLVSGSALAAQWQSPAVAVLLGATVGYAFSLLTLLINVLFEQPSPDIDQKVPRTMFQFIMKIGAALLTGGLVALVVVFAGEAGLAMEQPEADSYEFQNLLGERWGVRGSIGLAILPLAVQFIVFRLVLVENLPPKARESINPDYDWRDSPTWVVLRTVQFFPNPTAIPACALVTVLLRDLVKSVLFLSPIQHQLLMTGAGVVVANVSAMTVHRLMESFPQLVGFFACVLSACLLCPWNFLFGAFTAVWIGVAVGSVLDEVVLRRMLQKEIKRRKETGEKDSTFFDTERAIMMEQWEQIDEPEEVTPVPSEPTREEKLDAYLQIAAQGLSPIDYARDWEEQREQERIEAQTPRRSTKSQSFLQIEGDGVDDGVDDDLDDLDAEPGAETLGDGDVGVLEDEGLEGATSSCMERAPSGLAEDKPMVLFFNAAALEDISPSAKASAAPSKEEPKGDRLPTEMQALEAPEEVPAVEQSVEVESAPRHDDDGGEAVADEGLQLREGALEIATPRDADAQLAELPELAELRAAAVGLVGEQSMSIDLALARRQPSQTHSLEQASLMVLGGGSSIRDEFELEDGFDFSREDPVEEPESKKPSKAISSRSLGGTSSLAQSPASPTSPVSPSRDLNPGLLSMQRPPADLWSRTHGRAPTATSLRSMAQQVQKSLATASGTLNPPSPSSPSSPSKRGQARRPSPRR